MGDNEKLFDLYVKLLGAISSSKEEIKSYIKEETRKLVDKIDEQGHKLHKLENKFRGLEENQLRIERTLRKNNIIIFGLDITGKEDLLSFVLAFFNSKLEIHFEENEINNVSTFEIGNGQTAAVKVEFVSFLKKQLIIKNAPKLKGSKIYISQDLCFKDRQDRKIIVQHLNQAREQGFSAKILSGNRLLINGDIYTVNQLQYQNLSEDPTEEKEKSNSAPTTPVTRASNNSFNLNTEDHHQEEGNYTRTSIQVQKEIEKRKRESLTDLPRNNGNSSSTKKAKVENRSRTTEKDKKTQSGNKQ